MQPNHEKLFVLKHEKIVGLDGMRGEGWDGMGRDGEDGMDGMWRDGMWRDGMGWDGMQNQETVLLIGPLGTGFAKIYFTPEQTENCQLN